MRKIFKKIMRKLDFILPDPKTPEVDMVNDLNYYIYYYIFGHVI